MRRCVMVMRVRGNLLPSARLEKIMLFLGDLQTSVVTNNATRTFEAISMHTGQIQGLHWICAILYLTEAFDVQF